MTEHASVIFVFFFLAEYASIVLICTLTSILFLGGYLYNNFISIIQLINFNYVNNEYINDYFIHNPMLEGLLYSISLGLKTSILVFIFI
jgi:NADH-ubiquinone oxidoreductase chain 1